MKCLILYWSANGNTKKVAETIHSALSKKDLSVDVMAITADLNVDLYEYDLVFMGAGSYQWIPSEPVQKFIKNTMNRYREGKRPIGAPKRRGKFAVVFCTYAGVHTGHGEGYTAGKYMAQFFEHLGFFVLDEWYTVGEFHGWEEGSKYGKLGDITGRPNQQDLDQIFRNTTELIQGLI
jgi:flavodoxin